MDDSDESVPKEKQEDKEENDDGKTTRRDVVHDRINPRDYSDSALMGMLSDQTMSMHHDDIKKELEARGL